MIWNLSGPRNNKLVDTFIIIMDSLPVGISQLRSIGPVMMGERDKEEGSSIMGNRNTGALTIAECADPGGNPH